MANIVTGRPTEGDRVANGSTVGVGLKEKLEQKNIGLK